MMPSLLRIAALLLALLCATPARADIAAEQDARYAKLPTGTDISPPRALEGMALALGRSNPLGIAEPIPAEHPSFDRAIRLVTRRATPHSSDFQTSARSIAPVKRGDVLLATFWARAAGASESAEGAFVFETEDGHRRSMYYRFECEREWRRFFVPFIAGHDTKAGEIMLRFLAGHGPQVLELGGFRVVSYGGQQSFRDLPFTPVAYRGRRADSPWRAQAAESIGKERKAPLNVGLRNSRGKIVPWHDVRIRHLQHAFGFGVAVSPDLLLADDEDGEAYRWRVLELFNQAEIDAGLDWGAPPEARELALTAAQWLKDYDITTRSHALLAADGVLPAELASLKENRTELRAKVLNHVREKVTAAKGLVSEWSAPLALTAENALGPGLLADVFRTAREADPDVKLLVHAGNVMSHGVDANQQASTVTALKRLIETRAPIQGILLGGNFGEQLLAPDRIWQTLDRFAELRLPLTIGDFEVDTWDEEAQADYTRDFLTTVFAHPSTVACAITGLWGKAHAVPNAAFFTATWEARPNANAWSDLVNKRWSSSMTLSTNGKGQITLKAGLGYYAIEIKNAGATKVLHTKLTKSGRWLVTTLPVPQKATATPTASQGGKPAQ
jgi:endo-1,4-beta-xylanase